MQTTPAQTYISFWKLMKGRDVYREALIRSPEQSAVFVKPKAHTAATLITQVSIETTSAACTGPEL